MSRQMEDGRSPRRQPETRPATHGGTADAGLLPRSPRASGFSGSRQHRAPHGSLAFSEGRFLTVHPFLDFNGRTIRLLLVEILGRLDLPHVSLIPDSPTETTAYFNALEAADSFDWLPLAKIWKTRFDADT